MNTQSDNVVIVSTKRTPIGQFLGCFSTLTAPQLGSIAIQASLKAIQLDPGHVSEVLFGCVLSAGLGQAPARQAAIGAQIPEEIGATTLNKVCGSGMKAIMLAHDLLRLNSAKIIVAGGMESMTNAPYLLLKARQGYRVGHQTIYDHLFLDGLEDVYDKGKLMGVFAESCAQKYAFSRAMQDDFATTSLDRAQRAIKENLFLTEIAPVTITTKTETLIISDDELPSKANKEKIPQLKPAFKADGTVTAANSSGISDGACAHILMRQSYADDIGLTPLATIIAHATHSNSPAWFTTAPIQAIQKVLHAAQWKIQDVDLFEINEAFAVVPLAAMKELNIPIEKINIHGGACALGHPIGASGARIVTTLIYALKSKGLKRGIAAICIGGGEATAIALEVHE